MLDLDPPARRRPRPDVRAYVEGLEEWLIQALDRFNIRGERRDRPGRDLGGRPRRRHGGQNRRHRRTRDTVGQLARRRAEHRPGPRDFDGIVPCGISEHGVTSLHALGLPVTMADADLALRDAWRKVFGHGL